MFLCKTTVKTFSEYVDQPVSFSGDNLPACPKCRANVYEPNFEQTHIELKVNNHMTSYTTDPAVTGA